ncbi:MAG: hypothetical protein HYU57_05455 [Micavibrio aeruginosavorus]|nr:hypothetical protein [Micavibrio aeruginosavorus]
MDLGSIFTMAAYGVGAVAAAGLLKSAIFTVPQKHEALITTFGKHTRTEQDAGLHVKWPWPINAIEDVIPTTLQMVKEELETKTKDDLFVTLPISIQFEVADTGHFHFNNADPVDQIKTIVSAAVRKYTSGKMFQELYNERDEISDEVIKEVSTQMKDYGVLLRRIVIDEPKAPGAVQEAFNKVRASERLVEAATNEAKANKVSIVAEAEANRDRDLLRGEGAAGYRAKIFEQYGEQVKSLEALGVSRHEAVQIMLSTMTLDTQREVGSHGNMILYANTNTTGGAQEQINPATLLAHLKALGAVGEVRVSEPARTPGGPAPASV